MLVVFTWKDLSVLRMSKVAFVSEFARAVLLEEISNGSMLVLTFVTILALALSEVYAHGVLVPPIPVFR